MQSKQIISVIPVLIILFSGCSVVRQAPVPATDKNLSHAVFSTVSPFNGQPEGLTDADAVPVPEVITVNNIPGSVAMSPLNETSADGKDSTKTKPVLQPLVIAGTALAIAGTGAAVAAVFGSGWLWLATIILFAASALITMVGWKKIKQEPKKYSGSKFAVATYLIIGLIGTAASVYLLFLLFAF